MITIYSQKHLVKNFKIFLIIHIVSRVRNTFFWKVTLDMFMDKNQNPKIDAFSENKLHRGFDTKNQIKREDISSHFVMRFCAQILNGFSIRNPMDFIVRYFEWTFSGIFWEWFYSKISIEIWMGILSVNLYIICNVIPIAYLGPSQTTRPHHWWHPNTAMQSTHILIQWHEMSFPFPRANNCAKRSSDPLYGYRSCYWHSGALPKTPPKYHYDAMS